MFVLIIEQHKVIISTQFTLYLHPLIWNQGVKFKMMLLYWFYLELFSGAFLFIFFGIVD